MSKNKACYARNKKALEKLLKQPSNRKCADCRQGNPTWASWNIGCFVCMSCAARHRGLGTHISKVRSATMDDWGDKMMSHFRKQGGNAGVNARYEAKFKGAKSSGMDTREFIRDKYVQKRWYRKKVVKKVVKKPVTRKPKVARDLINFSEPVAPKPEPTKVVDAGSNPADWTADFAPTPMPLPKSSSPKPPKILIPGAKTSIMDLFKQTATMNVAQPEPTRRGEEPMDLFKHLSEPTKARVAPARTVQPFPQLWMNAGTKPVEESKSADAPPKKLSVAEAMRQAFGSPKSMANFGMQTFNPRAVSTSRGNNSQYCQF